ncbi:hypothetical protein [Sphingobium aromaticiconvertens]|uniref:hypothetical protein n=1 Tax=Sphingobium aromaticiconvertens TaxID=365341 RepID=UPI00301B0E19
MSNTDAAAGDVHTSICRLCTAFCPIQVTVEEGRATRIVGNPRAPLYGGYTCPKGRALPEQHYGPQRLLHTLKRGLDGGFAKCRAETAMDEISDRLQSIIDDHGPRAVAVYVGMGTVPFVVANSIAGGWLRGLGSPMFFTAGSIDKPGILIALAHHGMWQAGQPHFNTAKGHDRKRGEADRDRPRVSETAKRAHIHMQPRPGEDPTILAAMIHVILEDELYDHDFVAANTQGLETLREAVAPYTPAYAAERAGVAADQIIAAARIFAGASNAGVSYGTGPNFATHSTLTESLGRRIVRGDIDARTRAGEGIDRGRRQSDDGLARPEQGVRCA